MQNLARTASGRWREASGSQRRAGCARALVRIWAVLALLTLSSTASAQTLADVVRSHSGGCTTAGGEGIADQLVRAHLCMYPGAVTTFAPHPNITVTSSRVHPLAAIQTRDALHAASRSGELRVSSAFRTLSEQYLLYHEGGCGLAARPGASNHQSGVAVDLSNYSAARSRMIGAGCRHPYPGDDPVHFDCPGPDMRSASILVFQRLWNANNPGDRIDEDGAYGPQTESRLARTPARGFASDGCMVMPPEQWGAQFVAQSFPVAADPPIVMRPGEELAMWIELRNSGNQAWDGNTRLATTEPRDRPSPFVGRDWLNAGRPSAVSGTVAPGATHRFTFTVRAPNMLGEHREHFGVVQEGVTWFSDPGQLGPADSQLEMRISVVAPDPMPAVDAGATEIDAGVGEDGGPDPETDAEPIARDGGGEPPSTELSGGCTCRAGGRGTGSPSLLFLAGLALALALRRRRASASQ